MILSINDIYYLVNFIVNNVEVMCITFGISSKGCKRNIIVNQLFSVFTAMYANSNLKLNFYLNTDLK